MKVELIEENSVDNSTIFLVRVDGLTEKVTLTQSEAENYYNLYVANIKNGLPIKTVLKSFDNEKNKP